MFHSLRLAVIVLFASSWSADWTHADIILSVDVAGGQNVSLGTPGANRSFEIFIEQETLATDSLINTIADFQIAGGIVAGGIVTAPGAPGTPNYFGAGNTNLSEFVVLDDDIFTINQEYTDGDQFVLPSPLRERLATVFLDTTDVAPGTYAITLIDPANSFFAPDFDNNTITPIPAQSALTFTVTAIPEPASIGLLTTTACGLLLRNRRQRARKT